MQLLERIAGLPAGEEPQRLRQEGRTRSGMATSEIAAANAKSGRQPYAGRTEVATMPAKIDLRDRRNAAAGWRSSGVCPARLRDHGRQARQHRADAETGHEPEHDQLGDVACKRRGHHAQGDHDRAQQDHLAAPDDVRVGRDDHRAERHAHERGTEGMPSADRLMPQSWAMTGAAKEMARTSMPSSMLRKKQTPMTTIWRGESRLSSTDLTDRTSRD